MLEVTYTTRAYPFVHPCAQTIAVNPSAAHLRTEEPVSEEPVSEEPVLSTRVSRESSGCEHTLLRVAGAVPTPGTEPFTSPAPQLLQPGCLFVLVN